MPSKSKTQQRLFGMADAIKEGKMSPKKSSAAAKIANSMSLKDIKDFSSTKQKGLPEKVKSKKTVPSPPTPPMGAAPPMPMMPPSPPTKPMMPDMEMPTNPKPSLKKRMPSMQTVGGLKKL